VFHYLAVAKAEQTEDIKDNSSAAPPGPPGTAHWCTSPTSRPQGYQLSEAERTELEKQDEDDNDELVGRRNLTM
jgi:hypothetical protein